VVEVWVTLIVTDWLMGIFVPWAKALKMIGLTSGVLTVKSLAKTTVFTTSGVTEQSAKT